MAQKTQKTRKPALRSTDRIDEVIHAIALLIARRQMQALWSPTTVHG